MTNRGSSPSWPMDATTLPQPRIGMALAATLILTASFCGVTAMLAWHVQEIGGVAAAWANEPPALIGTGAFALGAALALVALVCAAASRLRNGPVWHAAATVLPDLPSEPVDSREYPYGEVQPARYVLKPVEGGWWFGSKAKHPYHGLRWFGIPWMTLVVAVILVVIWLSTDDPIVNKSLITCLVVAAWVLTCVVLWFLPNLIKPSPFAAIDLASGVCKLGPEPLTSVPLDQIVAVQLCACRRMRQNDIADGIEVNLVWRPTGNDAEAEIEKYRRMTLMFIVGPAVFRPAQLAGQLAEKLGVPLVCHATREHWRVERRAARLRRPAKVKWPPVAKMRVAQTTEVTNIDA